jgi:DNA-3-methyladenine glycosylase II
MTTFARYDKSVAFLRKLDRDWAALIKLVGPCLHDPKAAREPYEALVRAIGYQQLTAKAGDAIITRLKALHPDVPFPAPEHIVAADFDALRACGFSGSKIATIKAISEGALSGLVPPREIAVERWATKSSSSGSSPSRASGDGPSRCC